MTRDHSPDGFEDCALHPDAILGTRTYEDVLFTEETPTPVNALTGEPPAHSQVAVDDAIQFAAEIEDDIPYLALPASVEAQVETGSPPFTAGVFFHFKATGSLQRHHAYKAAVDSERYDVSFEADYDSGDLTITVTRCDGS